jgi:hypothetical protein
MWSIILFLKYDTLETFSGCFQKIFLEHHIRLSEIGEPEQSGDGNSNIIPLAIYSRNLSLSKERQDAPHAHQAGEISLLLLRLFVNCYEPYLSGYDLAVLPSSITVIWHKPSVS